MVFDASRIWIKKVADHKDAVLESATCCGEAALTRRLHDCIPYAQLPPRSRSAHRLHVQRFSSNATFCDAVLRDATPVKQLTLGFNLDHTKHRCQAGDHRSGGLEETNRFERGSKALQEVPDRSFTHRYSPEPRTASGKLISSRIPGDAFSSRYAPIRRMPDESMYEDQASFQDFRTDGYVVINNFLSGSELQVLRQVQILVRQLRKAQPV